MEHSLNCTPSTCKDSLEEALIVMTPRELVHALMVNDLFEVQDSIRWAIKAKRQGSINFGQSI